MDENATTDSGKAWLEFEDVETGEVLRSQRETTQPNEKDTVYWATGLTPVYLAGRTRSHSPSAEGQRAGTGATTAFRRPCTTPRASASDLSNREPILDPFSVYDKNPGSAGPGADGAAGLHLRQIIRDFDLVDERDVRLETTDRAAARVR